MHQVGPMSNKNFIKRFCGHRVALSVELSDLPDGFRYWRSKDFETAMRILFLALTRSRDNRLNSLTVLRLGQRFQVHLGPTDRIGMERERNMQDFHETDAWAKNDRTRCFLAHLYQRASCSARRYPTMREATARRLGLSGI